MLPPGSTGKGFQDIESIAGAGNKGLDVWGKSEVGVKNDAQYAGGAVEGENGVLEGDVWVQAGLMEVGGEKGGGGFGKGYA